MSRELEDAADELAGEPENTKRSSATGAWAHDSMQDCAGTGLGEWGGLNCACTDVDA